MTIKVISFLLLSFFLGTTIARADDLITTVFNVMKSERSDRLLLLSGADGRVYKMKKSEANLKLLNSFRGQVVKLTYEVKDEESLILGIKKAEVNSRAMDLNYFQYDQLRQFAPTDLQSEEKAVEIFETMINDGDRNRSQCFKRAHMWAFDLWSKMGINSQKVFIFYTQRYIQMEDFEWWFHVAPMVVASGEEYVLDGTFMKEPVTVKAWMTHFIKSENINCPVIENYKDFEDNQWNRLCYLMKVPMFYFSPLDIEHRDTKGKERNHWVLEELQDARRAFKNYTESYEALDSGKPTTTF